MTPILDLLTKPAGYAKTEQRPCQVGCNLDYKPRLLWARLVWRRRGAARHSLSCFPLAVLSENAMSVWIKAAAGLAGLFSSGSGALPGPLLAAGGLSPVCKEDMFHDNRPDCPDTDPVQ